MHNTVTHRRRRRRRISHHLLQKSQYIGIHPWVYIDSNVASLAPGQISYSNVLPKPLGHSSLRFCIQHTSHFWKILNRKCDAPLILSQYNTVWIASHRTCCTSSVPIFFNTTGKASWNSDEDCTIFLSCRSIKTCFLLTFDGFGLLPCLSTGHNHPWETQSQIEMTKGYNLNKPEIIENFNRIQWMDSCWS